MTTTDPRWTDETRDLLVEVLNAHNFADADTCECGYDYTGQGSYQDHQAEVYLVALADAGLLTPPGTQTRTIHDADGKHRQRIHYEPWQPVPCTHGARWAPAARDGIRTWHCRSCPATWQETLEQANHG